jgi:hypothetical protein
MNKFQDGRIGLRLETAWAIKEETQEIFSEQ